MCYKTANISTNYSSLICWFDQDHINAVTTRFGFRLWLLLLLLSDYRRLLHSLCGDWCRWVQARNSYWCRLNALSSYRCRLDPLGADLCRWEANPVHCHQLHVVEMDSGSHAYSGLSGQCRTRSLRSNLVSKIKLQ